MAKSIIQLVLTIRNPVAFVKNYVRIHIILVSYVVSMPDYKGLRGLLVTKDAHKLYEKYGYEIINDRAMMRSPES